VLAWAFVSSLRSAILLVCAFMGGMVHCRLGQQVTFDIWDRRIELKIQTQRLRFSVSCLCTLNSLGRSEE
jgi:hypothetical protein